MNSGKVGKFIAAIIVFVALAITLVVLRESREQITQSTTPGETVPIHGASTSRGTIAQLSVGASSPTPATRSISIRSMLEWQRDLYDSQTTAKAFADGVNAAEAGDLIALREIHDLLVTCKEVMQYVREGGERERWMSSQLTPSNGIRWFEPFYDRCAAIATSATFARWPLTEGRLTAAFWEQLGAKFDDPLLRSFAIAEDIDTYALAEIGQRAELRARMVDNLHRVLRSGDAAAWWDLGLRLLNPHLAADRAVGIALVQVSCERGYDCTKNNVHNFTLRCDGSFDPNCGSAATNQEAFAQRESAATIARAQALSEQLNLLLSQGDWNAIEDLVPLDGTAFR